MNKDVLATSSSTGVDTRMGIAVIHARLRAMILDGVFPPGSMLSQVKLAEQLGVGRLPLREALRMLQEEGLVDAKHNQRARIPPFDPQVVDALYATRLPLEALGIQLTVPRLQQRDLDALEQALDDIDTTNDSTLLAEAHRRFHRLLVQHAGMQISETLARYADHSEYYRRMGYRQIFGTAQAELRETVGAEHRAILNACREHDVDEASRRLILHLAGAALALLALMAPQYHPVALRTAMHVVGANLNTVEKTTHGKWARKKASL